MVTGSTTVVVTKVYITTADSHCKLDTEATKQVFFAAIEAVVSMGSKVDSDCTTTVVVMGAACIAIIHSLRVALIRDCSFPYINYNWTNLYLKISDF